MWRGWWANAPIPYVLFLQIWGIVSQPLKEIATSTARVERSAWPPTSICAFKINMKGASTPVCPVSFLRVLFE